jgi:hypothetical protein
MNQIDRLKLDPAGLERPRRSSPARRFALAITCVLLGACGGADSESATDGSQSSSHGASIETLRSNITVSVTKESEGGRYRIEAHNLNDIDLQEVELAFQGGTNDGGEVGEVLEPLEKDTEGRAVKEWEMGGRPEQHVNVGEFGAGKSVSVTASYPPSGTCIAAWVQFVYDRVITQTTSSPLCDA